LGGSTPPPAYGEVPMDEASMSARIEEALRASPMLEDDSIAVRVEGSRVHLAGLVDSPTEVSAARDIVTSIPGVQEVIVEQLQVITQRWAERRGRAIDSLTLATRFLRESEAPHVPAPLRVFRKGPKALAWPWT